jgi:hypothetical protein
LSATRTSLADSLSRTCAFKHILPTFTPSFLLSMRLLSDRTRKMASCCYPFALLVVFSWDFLELWPKALACTNASTKPSCPRYVSYLPSSYEPMTLIPYIVGWFHRPQRNLQSHSNSGLGDWSDLCFAYGGRFDVVPCENGDLDANPRLPQAAKRSCTA